MKASDVFQMFMMVHGVLKIAVRRSAPVVCVWPDSYKVLGFQIYVMFLVYAVFLKLHWLSWGTIFSVSPSEMDTLPAFGERSSFDSQFPYVYGRFPTLVTCSGTHRLVP